MTVVTMNPHVQVSPSGVHTTIIHLSFPGGPNGEERVACMPHMTEFHQTEYHPTVLRSNHPVAVTCPACKRTDRFLEEARRQGVDTSGKR